MKKLVSKLIIVSAVVMFCSSICLSQQTSTTANVPEGWKKIDANGLFTFYLPENARDTGFSGTEDYYKDYRIGKLAVRFVHEPMSVLAYESREDAFGKGFQESVVEISGEKAFMFSYSQIVKGHKRYYTEIHVGDLPAGRVKLWMQADSARLADLEIAKKIFGTIKFLQPSITPGKSDRSANERGFHPQDLTAGFIVSR